MQAELESKGFTVLAFPSNQFGHQEPGSNSDIQEFTRSKYSVNFPIFSRNEYLEESAVYQYLTKKMWIKPKWNFCKYLVDRQGRVVQFFSERDSFDIIQASVNYLLSKAYSDKL